MNLLAKLHVKATGYVGLAFGGAAIVAAVTSFFALVADPHYLVNLAVAANDLQQHRANDADHFALAQLAGRFIGIIGSTVVAVVGSYLGLSHFAQEKPNG